MSYIEKKFKLFNDKLLDYSFALGSTEIITPDFIGLLEKVDFWDFRSCEEYPDCLSCYEDDECRRIYW